MSEQAHQVDMNPGRVCRAISKIGYSPVAAIKDIIDNSVAAAATEIQVILSLREGVFRHYRNSIEKYTIVDNGLGMTNDEILGAFQLGVDVKYDENSLSKYGLGLKSAGLSLGNRITVISKKDNKLSKSHYIDLDRIDDDKKYLVYANSLSKEDAANIDILINGESGTIVIIEKCNYENQASLKSVADGLREELGIVYYSQLTNRQFPLSILLKEDGTNRDDVVIDGYDILFAKYAQKEFDPDNYDCIHPCEVINKAITIPGADEPATLEAMIFPKASMSRAPDMDQEQRELIKSYKVGRRNMGFFIYRNGRLIRWGDRLFTPFGPTEAIIGKDEYGFRARLSVTSAHDDALHVDVSKQKIQIPEDLESILRAELVQALQDAKLAFIKCSERAEETGSIEGDNFNIQNQYLEEEYPLDEPENDNDELRSKREQDLVEESEAGKEENEAEVVSNDGSFRRIRYSSQILGGVLYAVGYNPAEGTYIRINKNTFFYDAILKKLNTRDSYRQVLEGVLWALAVSDNLLYKKMLDVDEDVLSRIIKKKNQLLSLNLDNWCNDNPDIID